MMFISSRSSSRFITFLFPTNQQARRSPPAPVHRLRFSLASSRPHPRPRGFASPRNPAPGSARSAAGSPRAAAPQRCPARSAPPQADGPGPRSPAPPAPSGSCVAYREGSAIYIYSSGLFLSDWHFEEQPGRVGGLGGVPTEVHSRPPLAAGEGTGRRDKERREEEENPQERQKIKAGRRRETGFEGRKGRTTRERKRGPTREGGRRAEGSGG